MQAAGGSIHPADPKPVQDTNAADESEVNGADEPSDVSFLHDYRTITLRPMMRRHLLLA